MSETVPAVPVNEPLANSSAPAEPPVTDATAASTPAAPAPAPRNKFDHMSKSVGNKARGFLSALHNAGEQIRGNINAALDGAGDAIAGRKSGELKSHGQNPKSAPVEVNTPAAPAAEPEAVPAEITPAPQPAPAAVDPATELKPESAEGDKVGRFFNNSLKRTVTLVNRVTGNMRSNATRTVESFGNTIAERKQRASRRFSKTPKPATDPTGSAEAAAVPSTTTPAETVPAIAAAPAAVDV